MLMFLKTPFIHILTRFTHFQLTSVTFMMMFICDIANNPDDTGLCSKCNQVSDLWKQLKLASELKFDLRDTVD